MLSDIRYAMRTFARNPGFAVIAILTLAVGIGANTAIFTVFSGILLHPLPYPRADRLVAIEEIVPRFARFGPYLPVTTWHFREWRKQSRSFEQLALVANENFALTGGGEPERIQGSRVSASFFPMLGVEAAVGRTFLNEEEQPGRDRVIVLGDKLWSRRFHRDPSTVGAKILLDGAPYQVVGVLPRDARLPSQGQVDTMSRDTSTSEFWVPFVIGEDNLAIMAEFNFGCIGRLKPGVSITQANQELDSIQAAIVSALPDKPELRAHVTGLQEQITGSSRSSLTLLLAAAGTVLLIVVVNLANLLLVRTAGRRRELAIRAAIGAGMGRLVRQMLTESLILAVAGGVLGALAAQWALAAIVLKAPLGIPGLAYVHIDGRVLAFVALVSLGSGILFGVLPAWRTAHADPQAALYSSGRGTGDVASGRVRSLLIAAEVALSAVCLIVGGLLVNSFVRLIHVEKGFQADHAVALGLGLPGTRYPDTAARVRFVRRLVEKAQALPGVVAAGISNRAPLSGEGSNLGINVEGSTGDRPIVDYRCVSAGFFRAVGIPLIDGRLMADSDREVPVSLVSSEAARRLWPGQNPLGRRFQLGGDRWITVIGVVGDVRTSLNRAPSSTVYLPYWQRDRSDFSFVVRTAMEPGSIAAALRSTARSLDPELVVPRVLPLTDIVDASVRQRRFQMALVVGFALAALLLAALGVYGVVSQSVLQRTREIGIRVALGASKPHLWLVVVRNGFVPVMAGLLAGVVTALAVTRSLSGLLFGVPAADPFTYAAVSGVLLAAALAACAIPARRATHVDPLEALRQE